jgi:hypothetical protein
VEVELLVQVDHPVAVQADAIADLLDRLNDHPDARPRVEHRAAAPGTAPIGRAASGRRAGAPPRGAAATGSARTTGARQDAAVHPVDAVAGFIVAAAMS